MKWTASGKKGRGICTKDRRCTSRDLHLGGCPVNMAQWEKIYPSEKVLVS